MTFDANTCLITAGYDVVCIHGENPIVTVERFERGRSSTPVLFRVLVLPLLHSEDPRDQSAEEQSGGVPHLGNTQGEKSREDMRQEERVYG